jgi:predicted Rossmann fold flavoprotein
VLIVAQRVRASGWTAANGPRDGASWHMAEHFDVIVIGGGGAGLMCAITAGQRGRRVLVLEHNDRVGKKIGISGGGRCNFTNLGATAANYLSERPEFCKSALARYTPWDFVALVEKHGIPYHEKKLGQQFCDGSSRAIIDMLLAECAAAGAEVRCSARITEVTKGAAFRVSAAAGELTCDRLVVATGGLSFAKLGATDFGHRLARQFGLRVTPLRPALVPLTFPRELGRFGELSGVAIPTVAQCDGGRFEEATLFTHRGISGPAVLQISSFWREGQTITFDLLPEAAMVAAVMKARPSGRMLANVLGEFWPKRLADAWSEHYAPDKPLVHYKQPEFEAVMKLLREWPFSPSGTEGYPKAEVTLGGVDTAELSSKTMEARKVPGLHFIGEVVDVTGWLGGYNFQWAWASGFAAGGAV